MSPAVILQLIGAFQAAIGAAPQVIELVQQAKAFFKTLFDKGLITKQQQDAISSQVDAIAAMSRAGIVPDSWKVEPNPV